MPHPVVAKQQANAYSSPWPLTVRLKGALWSVVQSTLFKLSPKPLNAWRLFLLKRFGATIKGRPFVSQAARIVMPWHLTLEDRSTLAPGAEAYCLGEVILRERCTIAQYAYLCTGTHDLEDARTPLMTGCIEVRPDVFVGAKALVLPGVILGEGCIVGAGAVVARDTDPWSIVVGNPARSLKRQRKKPLTINRGETP